MHKIKGGLLERFKPAKPKAARRDGDKESSTTSSLRIENEGVDLAWVGGGILTN